jgi:hypothetical protein
MRHSVKTEVCIKTLALNVAVKWLAFLLSIRDVLVSNLDPQTGYLN